MEPDTSRDAWYWDMKALQTVANGLFRDKPRTTIQMKKNQLVVMSISFFLFVFATEEKKPVKPADKQPTYRGTSC